jgi:hypothetical protein
MKNKNKLFFYCCDFAKYRGEGILANNFKSILKKIFKDINIIVYNPENKFVNNKKKINHNFFYKYFTPIFGILIIWVNHLKGNRTAYVNYLPLWNFFLFIFLPKKTILGPITGGIYQGKDYHIKTILRKIIIRTFYLVSVFFIRIRNLKCIFSTQLLFNFLPNKVRNESIFNFQLNNLSFFKKVEKKIDILYYHRNYHTKNNDLILPLLYKLKDQFNILIIGKKLKNFKNLGIISRNKTINILKKTKFVFSSPENPLSYFVLDAILCNARIISSYNQKPNFFSDRFIYLKKNDVKNLKKILLLKDKKYNNKEYAEILKNHDDKTSNFIKKNYGN